VATEVLARADAASLAILGYGEQAVTHLAAFDLFDLGIKMLRARLRREMRRSSNGCKLGEVPNWAMGPAIQHPGPWPRRAG
jgi:ornithine cyclodeaminase/alanine dehydrogenase-like protein (mu-crystallin family)